MKNTRKEKGITLIALIVTVIVLLILAVVSIKTIQNNGIIERANSTTTKYEDEKEKEKDVLQSYEDLENKYAPNGIDNTNDKDTVVDNTNTENDSDINDDDQWTDFY